MNPGRPPFADAYRRTELLDGGASQEELHGTRLDPGQLVGGRFRIERFAGAGGMATVYRAQDLETNLTVALKVIGRRRVSSEERFAREAGLLSQVSHPAVVRYVAHGLTEQGLSYLAMEWLAGQDLASRLEHAGLTIDETLTMMRRLCTGLSALHLKGITHRDIKPGNVFLVDGRADAVKLLDFGVARQQGGTRTLTVAGMALGTIGYMAPEQAMGVRDIDPRADVFALGCVLFECLTGAPAFAGPEDIAVLAKVLRDDVPHVRELRPDIDESLDALVAGLLTKDRTYRPRDADAVLRALSALGELRGSAAPPSRRPTGARLVGAEQRIASVILARPEGPAAATLASSASDDEAAQLEDLLQRFGAQPIPLRAGQLLLVFGAAEGTIASDQAVQAVRCALRLRSLRPRDQISVATGGLDTAFNVSVGVAIDRAAALLDPHSEAPPGVRIDELTAGLLGGRFDIERSSLGLAVLTGVEAGERPRLLLGEPSPCVGREKELGLLAATLHECIEDQVARALLVTAQPGIGKSRLGREFLERVRGEGLAGVFLAHAEPMSVRSALNLVQRLLHHAIGLHEGEPLPRRRAQLAEHVARLVEPAQRGWLGEFLGELMGVPSADSSSPLLRAARNDPTVMREQTRRAVQHWLAAEVAHRPLVILLEDVQWADLPSVTYLEESVRALADRPILLLALARPDVHDHFPELFRAFGAQELRLLGLTRRAADRLAREVLPAHTDGALIERIVQLADGNAFYLEELIRHVAEGGTELPETLRAIVQSRLEGLEPESRRQLRAASVFGETCWVGGVAALLGSPAEVASGFEQLTREEILVQRPKARFPDELEYVFRHALLRDAAYAMLTEADRRVAHELAAEWLEAAGERDAGVLADHYERGTTPARAQPWLLRAARGALGNDDFPAALTLSERGLALGASGRERGELLLVQSHASAWGTHTNLELAQEALALNTQGTVSWWFSLALVVFGSSAIGRSDLAEPYLELAAATPPPSEESLGAYGQAFEVLALSAVLLGRADIGWSVLDKFQHWTASASDLVSLAWLNTTRCQLTTNALSDGVWQLERAVEAGREAVAGMRAAGAVSGEATALLHLGIALREVGRYEDAEQTFRESQEKAAAVRNVLVAEFSSLMLAVFALRSGQRERGLAQLAKLAQSSDANLVHSCTAVRAEVSLRSGQIEQAVVLGQEALAGPGLMHRIAASVTMARAQLALARPADALAVLDRAHGARGNAFPQFELDLLATRAKVLRALGDASGAADCQQTAIQFADRTTSAMQSSALRAAFQKRVALSLR